MADASALPLLDPLPALSLARGPRAVGRVAGAAAVATTYIMGGQLVAGSAWVTWAAQTIDLAGAGAPGPLVAGTVQLRAVLTS